VTAARAEDKGRGTALAILAMAMVVAAGALIHWGRGQVMIGDDLFYAQRLSENALGHVILHSNVYLIALPMVLYKAMFEVFGIGSYLPYRLAAIILALLCATLFYSIARPRIGSLLALAPTILLLFFGSGWEVLITGVRIPSLFAIASGLAAILLLEREDGGGDASAAVLLCVSVTSHPTGLGFLAAAAVMVAFRPSPRRWKSSWVVLIPAALFGAFVVFYQRAVDAFPPDISDVLAFGRTSWTMLTAAVSGLSGVLEAPVYDRLLAEIASMALLAMIFVGAALRWRRLRPTFWAAVAGLVTLVAATRLSPGGLIRPPDSPRYLYPETVLFLWILVELAAAWRDAGTAWTRTVVAGLATGVLLLGLWSNFAKLGDASSTVRRGSMVAQGGYSAYDLERGRLRSSYTPNPFAPTAGNYLSAAAAYGSMGLPPSELARAPELERASADRALVGALGLELRPAPPPRPAQGRPPQVEKPLGSTSITQGSCVALRLARDIGPPTPPAASAPAATQPLLAELDLPAGGAWIGGDHLGDATFTLGRFADPPIARLTPQVGNSAGAALRIPPDRAGVPWKLQIASRNPVTVCGTKQQR
jgi:hypothetical protein